MSDTTFAVTGATGFLASHIVKRLLARKFTVHATVRSLANKSKYEFLQQLPNADTHLKVFEADLLKEGSFDEAFKGASVVLHVASPFQIDSKLDPQKDLVDPAVKGTQNVLNSSQHTKEVRRVVITSSVAAVFSGEQIQPDKVFNEEDWNTVSSLTNNPYSFSKVEAEKAAWNYIKEKNPHFDIVTLQPPLIVGPILSKLTQDDLNTSSQFVLNALLSLKKGEPVGAWGLAYIHVDDIAELHVLAGLSTNPKVSNNRFILSEGAHLFTDVARIALKEFPNEFSQDNFKVGGDEEQARAGLPNLNTSKVRETFPDLKITPIREIVIDAVKTLKELKLL
jgi:dihydroflavonol-4-reductase